MQRHKRRRAPHLFCVKCVAFFNAHAPTQALAATQAASERGAAPIPHADRVSLAANLSCLSREAAFEALHAVSKRPAAIEAVYAYWLEKRRKLGKPALRRLQPPPAGTDANPFNVFRPREKTNRPQTRRRRENDVQAFHRMRSLRHNLDTARAILEWLQRRERRKRDILACEMEMQAISLRLRHDPAHPPVAAMRPPPANGVTVPNTVDKEAPDGAVQARAAATAATADAAKGRKRRRDGRDRRSAAVVDTTFVAPPERPEPVLSIAQTPLLPPTLSFPAAARAAGMRGRLRFGRGGRLVFDRCDLFGVVLPGGRTPGHTESQNGACSRLSNDVT